MLGVVENVVKYVEAVGTHYCSTLHVRVTVQTVWDADQDEPGCKIIIMCPPYTVRQGLLTGPPHTHTHHPVTALTE